MKTRMDKSFTIGLCGLLLLGLCGCGKKTELESGTYKSPSIFDTTFKFNENGTYEVTAPEQMGNSHKGTYSADGDSYVLKGVNNQFIIYLGQKDGIFYLYNSAGFNTTFDDGDTEYGLKFTVDKDGRTDQKFEDSFLEGSTAGRYHVFSIDFNTDGTCLVHFYVAKSYYNQDEKLIEYKYEGTYTVDGSIVNLKYNGEEHPLVIDGEDGELLHFYTLKK